MNELRWKMICIDGHWHSVSCKEFLKAIKEVGICEIQATGTLARSNIVETYHQYVALSSPAIAFLAVFLILVLSGFVEVYGSKFRRLDNTAYFAICASG